MKADKIAGIYFDSHIHADACSDEQVANLRYFGVRGALIRVHGDPRPPLPEGDARALGRYLDRVVEVEIPRLREAGLHAVAAVAIPPGRTPVRGWEPLLRRLETLLNQPEVAALGTVGLCDGSEAERELLRRQLRLAVDAERPVIMAVPRSQHSHHVDAALSLLTELEVPPQRTLLDQLDLDSARHVLELGYFAGLTVSRQQLSAPDAAGVIGELADQHRAGIVVGSGASGGAGDVVAISRAAAAMRDAGIAEETIHAVTAENAMRLFDVPAAELAKVVPRP